LWQNVRVWLLGTAAGLVLRLIGLTLRWKYGGLAGNSEICSGQPKILAFWHNQQLFMPYRYRELKRKFSKQVLPMSVLISAHSDGRIISRGIEFFGIGSVAGSSSRGGARALRELLGVLAKGEQVSVTPDGPRGPSEKVKAGIIKLAELSQAPIYPIGMACRPAWRVKSWDRMYIPRPFSRAVMVMGQAFYVPKDVTHAEIEQYRKALEEELEKLNRQAEQELA
jgi:hypothetical protein